MDRLVSQITALKRIPYAISDYTRMREENGYYVDNRLNGNFSLLKTIIEEGQTTSQINHSFPLDQLLNRENFISLLYYFGLLSMDGQKNFSGPCCVYPIGRSRT